MKKIETTRIFENRGNHLHYCPLCGTPWNHAVSDDQICAIVNGNGVILDSDNLYCYECEKKLDEGSEEID